MAWHVYRVAFRLRSPLHIGRGKVGNLQRTRPYVTGRVLWGALTMRLTRDAAGGLATDSRDYLRFGEEVHRSLTFTYFYPALKLEEGYKVVWPWEDESAFRRRFLSSYQGTALSYPQQSAAEGMLHEVEFLSPYTLDAGEPVFLTGFLFEKEGCMLNWKAAFARMQMGGERGYGWGDVELVVCETAGEDLFDGAAHFKGGSANPIIHVPANGRLLAHVRAENLPIAGNVEPLVAREWQSHDSRYRYAGQCVTFNGICFIPGTVVPQALDFAVEEFGLWRMFGEVAKHPIVPQHPPSRS